MTDTAEPTALRAGFTQTEAFRALETQITALDQRIAELREYTGTALNLQQLIMQTTLACATCLHEERTATRAAHNLANTIVDGTAYCNEYLDDVNGRLVPRKSSGLIVTGG